MKCVGADKLHKEHFIWAPSFLGGCGSLEVGEITNIPVVLGKQQPQVWRGLPQDTEMGRAKIES